MPLGLGSVRARGCDVARGLQCECAVRCVDVGMYACVLLKE